MTLLFVVVVVVLIIVVVVVAFVVAIVVNIGYMVATIMTQIQFVGTTQRWKDVIDLCFRYRWEMTLW